MRVCAWLKIQSEFEYISVETKSRSINAYYIIIFATLCCLFWWVRDREREGEVPQGSSFKAWWNIIS